MEDVGLDSLRRLAELIAEKDAVEQEIAALTGRPTLPGHVGEYVAAASFDLELHPSAVARGSDGVCRSGLLAGRSVNVKWCTAFCRILDIRADALPDSFLVLGAPYSPPGSSRGRVLPWVIETVYLFEATPLVAALAARGVKVGVATSVTREIWEAAAVYPTPRNPVLAVSDAQRELLALFR